MEVDGNGGVEIERSALRTTVQDTIHYPVTTDLREGLIGEENTII